LCTLARGAVLLNLIEELGALGSPVVDKGFDILFQTLNRLLHLLVPGFGALQASFQVQELLVCALVPVDNCASLPLE